MQTYVTPMEAYEKFGWTPVRLANWFDQYENRKGKLVYKISELRAIQKLCQQFPYTRKDIAISTNSDFSWVTEKINQMIRRGILKPTRTVMGVYRYTQREADFIAEKILAAKVS